MGLKEALESILKFGKASDRPAKPPVSMVLLLKEPRFTKLEELRQAAERAYGVNFSLQKTDRHCVYSQVLFTIMNVGPHALSFLSYTKPYGADSPALGITWNLAAQRETWAQHTSYLAVDYVKGSADFESQYVVIARLCRELYNVNCVGIFLPRESGFVTGASSVRDMLDRAGASRNVEIA